LIFRYDSHEFWSLKPSGLLGSKTPHPAFGHPLPVVEGLLKHPSPWGEGARRADEGGTRLRRKLAVGSRQLIRSQKPEGRSQKEFAASLVVEAADPGGNPIGVGWGEPAKPNNSNRLRWASQAHPNLRDSKPCTLNLEP